MRLFDPLGLLGTIIVILMQHLWKPRINWDDELSKELKMKWKTYLNNLDECNNFSIPRWLKCDDAERILYTGLWMHRINSVGLVIIQYAFVMTEVNTLDWYDLINNCADKSFV